MVGVGVYAIRTLSIAILNLLDMGLGSPTSCPLMSATGFPGVLQSLLLTLVQPHVMVTET